MSNPVQPPPPGGNYQPPANQGFGGPGQPGPAPQQGYGAPGQPGPGPQQGFGDAPAPKKSSGIGKRIIGIVVAIVIAGGIFLVKNTFFGDKTADAKVGDCVAASGDEKSAEAKVVKCGTSEAAYTVVGRVAGETDVNGKACDQYFTEEGVSYSAFSVDKGNKSDNYMLCLKPTK